MNRILLGLFFYVCSSICLGQSTYFKEFRKNIANLSTKNKIDSIAALPFDVMNSQTAEAITLYEEGLELAVKIKDNNRVGEMYDKLGLAYYYKGEYETSVQNTLEAIHHFEKSNNKEKAGSSYATLGHQMKRRNLPKAFEYMRKGIRILESSENKLPLSAAYNNFGVLFEMNNDVDSALYFYFKGLEIIKGYNDSLGIPYSLNNIGQAYLSKKEFKKAKPYFDEAFKIRTLRNDQNGLAENFGFYGDFYYQQNQFQQAIDNYLKSLFISEQINYTYLSQTNSEQLAIAYEQIGDYKNSLIYRKKFQAFKDQLLNEQSNKTIAQLEIQFDTEKKEKEIAQQNERISKHLADEKQRNALLAGLSIAFILLTVLAVLIYRQQRFKQERLKEENRLKDAISEEQTKNKLHEERLRISRDLHDNIGSQLTFITSSMDNMKFITKEEKITNKLTDLTSFTRSTIGQLRDTIWAMNKGSITAEDLKGRLLNYIEDAKKTTDSIEFVFTNSLITKELVFSATQGVNLFRIVQESVNNAVKYALPSKVIIEFKIEESMVNISISDDGIGFSKDKISLGNGLKNMELRAIEIGGVLNIISSKDAGTIISVEIEKDKLNDV